jgi:hypothetical protein
MTGSGESRGKQLQQRFIEFHVRPDGLNSFSTARALALKSGLGGDGEAKVGGGNLAREAAIGNSSGIASMEYRGSLGL